MDGVVCVRGGGGGFWVAHMRTYGGTFLLARRNSWHVQTGRTSINLDKEVIKENTGLDKIILFVRFYILVYELLNELVFSKYQLIH